MITKHRWNPENPPRDIVNYWLLNITNETVDIFINFTDYKVISESRIQPDVLKIDFIEPQNLRRLGLN